MSEGKNQPKKKEIRILICKGCKGGIDEMGCGVTCKYDTMNFGDRAPATMEMLVYIFDRVEPYSKLKSKKEGKKDG